MARFIQHLPFPVISSNIDAGDEPELQSVLSGSAVINLDGENVGVVGYTYGDGAMNTNIGKLGGGQCKCRCSDALPIRQPFCSDNLTVWGMNYTSVFFKKKCVGCVKLLLFYLSARQSWCGI